MAPSANAPAISNPTARNRIVRAGSMAHTQNEETRPAWARAAICAGRLAAAAPDAIAAVEDKLLCMKVSHPIQTDPQTAHPVVL